MRRVFDWEISPEDFDGIIKQPDLVGLIDVFEKNEFFLSSSLLIWSGGNDSNKWILADFGDEKRDIKKRLYHIDKNNEKDGERIVLIVPRSFDWDLDFRFKFFENDEYINGTRKGLILALKAEHQDNYNFTDLVNSYINRRVKDSLTSSYNILDYIIKAPIDDFIKLSGEDIQRIIESWKRFIVFIGQRSDDVQESILLENEIKRELHQIANVISVAEHSGIINEHSDSINELSAKESVSKYKTVFTKQAIQHKNASKKWLIATCALAVVSIGAYWWLFRSVSSEGTALAGILQSVFTKGFLLTLIYILLNRFIKNYTAQKHLEVINRHRQNALETFEAFYDVAKNQETKDAVLRAATKAIFDANQSGYLPTKTKGSESANPVQQIFKEIGPSSSDQSGG